jgi:outer membrane protein insertion porin family
MAVAWVLFLFFCFAEPGFSNSSNESTGRVIARIDIQIPGEKGDIRLWDSIARDLIQLKPGDAYSLGLMEQAIARLSDSNIFKSIHVPDPVETARGLNIRFELVPYGRIKDIRIYKAFPLFDREVLNVMTLYNGDAFLEASLGEQAKRVIALFKKQGFIDPRVTLSAQKDAADGNYVLSVHIDKGKFLRVNRVEIKGNAHFSSPRLKLRIKTWKSSVLFGSARRFIQKDLDEDVKNFISFYRKKGFADVSIRGETIRDLEEKKVDVIFHVEEGPCYEIVFQGNEKFWDYTLKKEMTLSRDGNKNNFGLRKSVRLLKKKYAGKGYPDVGVDSGVKEMDPSQPLVKQVTLTIDEGDQYRVSKIELSGNRTILQKEIFKNMLTRESGFGNRGIYVAKILDEDINAIRSLYLREGFTRTRVDKHVRVLDSDPDSAGTKPKGVAIQLVIDEGIQTKVDRVQFEGASVLSEDAVRELISLKPGQPFRGYMMENDENSLGQKISELGYPHNKVAVTEEFSSDRSRVNLTYTIWQGPYVRVGQLYYVGNFRTKPQVLDTEMNLSTGDPLSLAKLLESRRNMMDINALDSVRFRTIGLKNNAEEVDIIVEVEEKKPYFFEIGTGYDTQRHLYLSSAVGDHNFLGRNLDLQLEGEVSQIGYKGNISLLEPRFLKTRTWSSTRVFGEEQEEFNKDFGIKSTGISQNFYQQFLSSKLTINLGVMYESRKQYLTQQRPLTPDEAEDYEPRHIIVARPGVVYKTIDSYVRPKKGTLSSFNVDLSNGIDNDLDDFIKYRLDIRYYYTLFEPLVFALRGRYRIIQPYGSNNDVPEDQLFFLGGTSSVRGFGENLLRYDTAGKAVGGRESLLGSVEARYDLGLNFEFSAFYDIGSIRQTQGRGGSEAFRDSVGLGLRYMTPIGPIGFLYGWKLAPRPNESAGSFHFSMGYTF